MGTYLMGIDNGGSMIKCAIYDEKGNEAGVGSRRLPLIMPKPGMTERRAEDVWRANVQAIRQALSNAGIRGGEIAAIGLTGYGNGACFVDARGEAVYNCIVSTDSRASGYLDRWQKDGTEAAVYRYTYQNLWAAQPAALLPWFRDHMPEVLRRAKYTLSIKDFIRAKLTGEICAEITDASSGCLMNIKTRQYDREIFRLLGIEEYFHMAPPFVGSTDITGRVSREAAALTGLAEGTPVAGGYFDIDAGALASGVGDDKTLCLIAGTWSINEYITTDLESGFGKFSNTVGYLPGYYVVEDSSPTSASNFDWFVRNFAEKKGDLRHEAYLRCDDVLRQMKPEDGDVLFIPYLYASATNPNSKGAFFNLSGCHTRDHLMQAVYEGVAFSTMFHVKRLTGGDWRRYACARFSGGASRSSVWAQMFCDVLQVPVEVLRGSESERDGRGDGCGNGVRPVCRRTRRPSPP